MTPPPPRKPRFLSSVPTQQQIEQPRFSAKPGPAQIRPLLADPQNPTGVKPGATGDAGGALTGGGAPASGAAHPAPGTTSAQQAQAASANTPAPAANANPAQTPPAPSSGTVQSKAQEPTSVPLDLVRSRLAAAIDALQLQSEKLAEQARADVLEVAFQVARRIVEVEVRQSPEPLFALVRASLGQLAAARRITLRVSPHDIDALRGARGQESIAPATLAEIELSADASLEPGECLIESDLGHIDGRLANRFAELRRHVAEAAEGAA